MKKIALIFAVLAFGLLVSCKKSDVSVTIEVNPEELVFTSGEGEQTVEVTCNSTWVAAPPATWAGTVISGNSITVHVLSNTGPEREATLYVVSGDVSKEVKITQQAAE